MSFKEKDIRDLKILDEYIKLVNTDSKEILDYPDSMVVMDQITWGLGESEDAFIKNGYIYQKCLQTGTLFVNPRPKLKYLSMLYSDSISSNFWVNEFFLPKIEARRKNIFKPRANYVSKKFKDIDSMKIADIGAGFGLFIDELQAVNRKKLDIVAIEPSHSMANICEKKGIKVNRCMLENLVGKTLKFDLMTSFELFEHLFDPLIFLKDCFKLLNVNGYLLLTTLSSNGFDIQTLWEKSNSIFPPQHLNFFNPASIKNILELVGFRKVEISTPGELDIDIVFNSYKSGNTNIPRFLKTIYNHEDKSVMKKFQNFLKINKLSSHMLVVAQK